MRIMTNYWELWIINGISWILYEKSWKSGNNDRKLIKNRTKPLIIDEKLYTNDEISWVIDKM